MVKDLKTRAFEGKIVRLEPDVVDKNRSNVPLNIGQSRIPMPSSVLDIPQNNERFLSMVERAVRKEI